MELPPQPDPQDFIVGIGHQLPSYHDALAAWERVCKAIVEAESRAALSDTRPAKELA